MPGILLIELQKEHDEDYVIRIHNEKESEVYVRRNDKQNRSTAGNKSSILVNLVKRKRGSSPQSFTIKFLGYLNASRNPTENKFCMAIYVKDFDKQREQ